MAFYGLGFALFCVRQSEEKKVSCGPGWLQTHLVAEDDLEFQTCATASQFCLFCFMLWCWDGTHCIDSTTQPHSRPQQNCSYGVTYPQRSPCLLAGPCLPVQLAIGLNSHNNGSVVKSTSCSCRRFGLSSQHPYQVRHNIQLQLQKPNTLS